MLSVRRVEHRTLSRVAVTVAVLLTSGLSAGGAAAQVADPVQLARANEALAQTRHGNFVAAYAQWSELEPIVAAVGDPVTRFWLDYNAATAACYAGARPAAARWATAALSAKASLEAAAGRGAIIVGAPGHDFQALAQDMSIIKRGRGVPAFWPEGEALSADGRLIETSKNGRLDEGTYTDASLTVVRGPVIRNTFRSRYERRAVNPLTGWAGPSGPSCEQGTSAFSIPAVLNVSKTAGASVRLTCGWAVKCRTRVRLQRIAGGRYVDVAAGDTLISPGDTQSVRLSPTSGTKKYLASGGRFRLIAFGSLAEKFNPPSVRQQAVRVIR